MALKNVTREDSVRYGRPTWLLRDAQGNIINAFSFFCEKNHSYAYATQKRYAEVVSQFIDYLIEANAFGTPASKRYVNAVIDAYPILLRDGSAALSERIGQTIDRHPDDRWLLQVSAALRRQPLKPKSFSNTLAAINRFLRLSEALAFEAFEIAALAGIQHGERYADLIEALSGSAQFSASEVRNMKQNSMLGSVIRFKPDGLTRSRAIFVGSATKIQTDLHHLDFPIEHVMALVNAASSNRDRALWLLLAASGIRVSEALNMLWSDIDVENHKVYVYDPNGRRFGSDMLPVEKLRFKGRAVSTTYLINRFRDEFFSALEQYYKTEFVTYREVNAPKFVFQYVEHHRRGHPLVGVSDASLNANFKAACERAQILHARSATNCTKWSIHSLRHTYGVYMLNDYPVDAKNGVFGLQLDEVQTLMGHKSMSSTKLYARKNRRALERKLEHADRLFQEKAVLTATAISEQTVN